MHKLGSRARSMHSPQWCGVIFACVCVLCVRKSINMFSISKLFGAVADRTENAGRYSWVVLAGMAKFIIRCSCVWCTRNFVCAPACWRLTCIYAHAICVCFFGCCCLRSFAWPGICAHLHGDWTAASPAMNTRISIVRCENGVCAV